MAVAADGGGGLVCFQAAPASAYLGFPAVPVGSALANSRWPDRCLCRGLSAEGGSVALLAAMLWPIHGRIAAPAPEADAAAQMAGPNGPRVTIYGPPSGRDAAAVAGGGGGTAGRGRRLPWPAAAWRRMGDGPGAARSAMRSTDLSRPGETDSQGDIWMGGVNGDCRPRCSGRWPRGARALGPGRVVDVALNGLGAVRFQALRDADLSA